MTLPSPHDRRPTEQEAPDRPPAEELLRIERDLAVALGSTSDLGEALDLVLDATLRTGEIDCGGIYLLNEPSGELRLVVHRGVSARFAQAVGCYAPGAPHTRLVLQGEPAYGNSTCSDLPVDPEVIKEGLRALAVLPTKHQGRVVAVMNLASHTRDQIAQGTRDALEAIAAQIGPIIARVGAETALRDGLARDIARRQQATETLENERQLLGELLDLQDKERRLLAYEIHDGCAQQLTGALMHLQGFRQIMRDRPDEAWQFFDLALRLLEDGVGEVRHVISGLLPPILDQSGAVAAIEYLVSQMNQRHAARIALDAQVSVDRLAAPLENTLFRVVQEALGNACRHSQSPRIAVRLWEDPQHVCAEVRDWGQGFDPAAVPQGHFGLQGIQERARLMGGRATIEAQPGQGTRVFVELPRRLAGGPA